MTTIKSKRLAAKLKKRVKRGCAHKQAILLINFQIDKLVQTVKWIRLSSKQYARSTWLVKGMNVTAKGHLDHIANLRRSIAILRKAK